MYFMWADYIIFSASLCLSAIISFYYGISQRKQSTTKEYLFGGGSMHSFPICMSNLASAVSSISLLSFPREAYYYGAQLYFICVGELSAYILMYFFYLPVFYELGFMSLFEYLEKRFNKLTRRLASAVYVVTQMLYLLAVIYATCAAVTQALRIPFHIFTPIICVSCTLYTAVGGLKGVVLSDALQAMIMFISLIIVIIIGLINIGGVSKFIQISGKGGRLDILNTDPSPFARHSLWLLTISSTFASVFRTCIHPGLVQRYRSLSTISKAKRVVIATGTANVLMTFLFVTLGVTIYATYHDCDPAMSESLDDKEQLTTYYVIQIGKKLPGMTGLFLAAVLSAALSSMSTIMNSCSGTTYEDLIKPFLPKKIRNTKAYLCLKIIVMLFGIIITGGIFCVNIKGGLFQFYRTIVSYTNGVIIYLFTYGLFYRGANNKGAIVGSILGIVISLWLGLGNLAAISSGKIQYTHKVISVEGCPENVTEYLRFNSTISGSSEYSSPVTFDNEVPYPYRISFHLITFIGFTVAFFIGGLISFSSKTNETVDERLLIPQIRKKENKVYKTNDCNYLREEMQILHIL